jgi:hypothetical protein
VTLRDRENHDPGADAMTLACISTLTVMLAAIGVLVLMIATMAIIKAFNL